MTMRILAHHDADGIASAVLYMIGRKDDYEIDFPQEFGDGEGDVMLDMRPKNPDFKGLVIDHHPNHPSNHKYNLIWNDVPTSLIVHENFMLTDWRVSVGLVGDGQPELIPLRVWENYPILLEESGWVYKSYGELKTSFYPVYYLLSSGINSLCRIGEEKTAFSLLKFASSPFDLMVSEEIKEAKEKENKETERVLSNSNIFNFKHTQLLLYESPFRLEGKLASMLQDASKKVVITLNVATRRLSIRGPYAELVANKLRKIGVEADGHAGYMGGSLKEATLEDLRKVLEDGN